MKKINFVFTIFIMSFLFLLMNENRLAFSRDLYVKLNTNPKSSSDEKMVNININLHYEPIPKEYQNMPRAVQDSNIPYNQISEKGWKFNIPEYSTGSANIRLFYKQYNTQTGMIENSIEMNGVAKFNEYAEVIVFRWTSSTYTTNIPLRKALGEGDKIEVESISERKR